MNIAESAIKKRVVTLVVTFLLVVGGIYLYGQLGQLEDPEFTIKDALIITPYPGASPEEVEQEVTEKIETKIQELAQVYKTKLKSESKAGLSTITVKMLDKYDKKTLPQVWDELRRKINDVQSSLPPGAGPSIVYDDYGDVYGVVMALTGEGFSYHDLKEIAKDLRREFLLVDDVSKVIIWGDQQEQINVKISRATLANFGVSLEEIYRTLRQQNLVTPSGSSRVGVEYLRIDPTGTFSTVDQIRNLIIKSKKTNKLVYLKDIAEVSREYISPPQQHMRFNGKKSIALGISTVSGGNVVDMGKAIEKRIGELSTELPLGIKLDYVFYQGEIVEKSVTSFVINLLEAIAIVIMILMIFMGMRSGILIGMVLLITVCATIIVMYLWGINLQRISLGALIIALGMLVDNAIVITEGILVRMQKGMDGLKASVEVVDQNKMPLLGATVIAILAFAAIGLSPDSTGEYCRSLFQVMLISLSLSWIIALTITPLLCTMMLKTEKVSDKETVDPYNIGFFLVYRKFLIRAVKVRWLTLCVVGGCLVLAIYGFQFLGKSFFPNGTSEYLMLHLWLPEGTDIRVTNDYTQKVETFMRKQEGVKSISSFVGAGAPRYTLVYSPEKQYSSYAILLARVDDYHKIDAINKKVVGYIKRELPIINPRFEKIRLGPGEGFPVEVRFVGPDPEVLRDLSDKAKAVMRHDPDTMAIRDNWRQRVKLIQPDISEEQARRAGITRSNVAEALATTFGGTQVGIYREGDELIPIRSQSPEREGEDDIRNLFDVLVWNPSTNKVIPLRQVVSSFDISWDDAVIHRRAKKRTITTQSAPITGSAIMVFERITKGIFDIPIPPGYERQWGGELESSTEAQQKLAGQLPPILILMIFISILLFNSLRLPLIIWLTVPFAIIGVTVGLLITSESFGFMALLGFLSLIGMLIKNVIVLLDEIEIQRAGGKAPFEAVIDSAVSRMRPVSMAALTTILGMIPLLTDVFFIGMAVTIMSGLAFATLLTLIIVPVFYCIIFRIKNEKTTSP